MEWSDTWKAHGFLAFFNHHKERTPETAMRLPAECYQIMKELEQRLPGLDRYQLRGLAMWVSGAILSGSACQNAVATALLGRTGNFNSVRQYLREWLYDAQDRCWPSRKQLEVDECFAALMKWVLSEWQSDHLALALDPTLKGDKVASIVVSVVYRSSAIPVAWRIMPANRKGGWMRPAAQLLETLAEAVPEDMKVVVMCDRGLRSPILWEQIRQLGWHPLVRQVKTTTFCPDGGVRNKASELVQAPGQAWVGTGTAFSDRNIRRRVTMVVVWDHGQKERWVLMTDLPPDEVGVNWYALRFWIELGFKGIKSMGWQWDKTRRTDPTRVARHWLVLAVATLLSLAYGTRVEDAQELGKAPGDLRAPRAIPPGHRGAWCKRHREVSVLRQGTVWLRRLLPKGRLWKRVWLLPEAWPQPPPTLKVKYGLDTWNG